MNKIRIAAIFLIVAASCIANSNGDVPRSLPTNTEKKSAKLPPCKSCTILTDSFAKVCLRL